jgi:putative ABC transport system substrate-binding protein
VHRIGYLVPGTSPAPSARDPLTPALGALGWNEGQNIVFERRYAGGKLDRLAALAAELAALEVSVIVAIGTPAAQAVKDATATIPIVMVNVADPVRSGLVTSLARPGGNVTGMAMAGPEITRKRLQLLKETLPRASLVGILFDPLNQAQLDLLTHDTPTAAAVVGLKTHPLKVDVSTPLGAVFAEARRARVDALVLYPLNRASGWAREVASLAITHRLPLLTGFRAYAEQGALMAINARGDEVVQRAAAYIDRLLRGAKPMDLPVELPTKYELVVNLKTARALALTIPQSVLLQADEVIE